MDEFFQYGNFKLKRLPLLQNILTNIDKYATYKNYNESDGNDFRNAIQYIHNGIKDGSITTNGFGEFYDTRGKLTTLPLYDLALRYIHELAHKQWELESKTANNSTEDEEEISALEQSKAEFNPQLLNDFIWKTLYPTRSELNPYNWNVYYTKFKDDKDDKELKAFLVDILDKYKKKYKNFDEFKFSSDEDKTAYINSILDLQDAINKGISNDVIYKMYQLGVGDPLLSNLLLLNKNRGNNPEPSNTNLSNSSNENQSSIETLQEASKNSSINELEESKWELTNNEKARLGSVAADLIGLFDPEPISSTILGVGSDVTNLIADLTDDKVTTEDALSSFKINALATIGSLIPFAGDAFFSSAKVARKILIAIPSLLSIPAINDIITEHSEYGDAIKHLWNGEITSLNARYLYNLVALAMSTAKTVKNYKSIGKKLKVLDTKSSTTIDAVQNGKTKKVALTDPTDISFVKRNKNNPQAIQNYFRLKYNWGELDFIEFDPKSWRTLWTDKVRMKNNVPYIDTSKARLTLNERARKNSKGEIKKHFKYKSLGDYLADKTLKNYSNDSEHILKGPNVQPNDKSAVSSSIDDLKARFNNGANAADVIDSKNFNLDDLMAASKAAGDKATERALGAFRDETKRSANYKKALEDLKDSGMSEEEALTTLKNLNLFKSGGIIKAQNGIKLKLKNNLDTYLGYDQFFELIKDPTDESKSYWKLKLGIDADNPNLKTWLETNKLMGKKDDDINDFGADYTYKEPRKTLYVEGTKSIGLAGANRSNRSSNLGHLDSVFNDEIDLNKHAKASAMYLGDQGQANRINDFISWAEAYYKEGDTLSKLLARYNLDVDLDYDYKGSKESQTYSASDATRDFNIRNRNRYSSLNTKLLHGYDENSENFNGSETMSRSIDITDLDIDMDFSNINTSNENLKKLLLNSKVRKAASGHYYSIIPGSYTITDTAQQNIEETPEHPETVTGVMANNFLSLKDVKPEGALIKHDPTSLLSILGYFKHLGHNNKLYNIFTNLDSLLYEPKELNRTLQGDNGSKVQGHIMQGQANSKSEEVLTPKIDKLMSFKKEMFNYGLLYMDLKKQLDDAAIRESKEKIFQQEALNKESRYNAAMKNRENMYATDREKLMAYSGKIRANHDSFINLLNEFKYNIGNKYKKDEVYRDYYYSRNLLNSITNNPSAYIDNWNAEYSRIWNTGNNNYSKLTPNEIKIYSQIKALIQLAYDNRMAKLYGLNFGVPNTNDMFREMDWDIQTAKKGTKLISNDLRYFHNFIKECNKNYHKDMNRSTKGMLNHIKLQLKK